MNIRILTANDAPSYRELRLAALREHPEAYVTDFAEEAALSLELLQSRLSAHEAAITFGALERERLVGIGTILWSPRIRQQFRATIVGMYVDAAYRRRGVGKSLIATLLQHAREQPDVEEVCLSVTCGNDAARKLYVACGFLPEYVEPRYFKYQDRYYDLEWLAVKL